LGQIEVKNDKRAPFREANGTTLVDFRPIFCPLDEETLDDLGTALAFAKESCEMESLTVLICDWKFFSKRNFSFLRLQEVSQYYPRAHVTRFSCSCSCSSAARAFTFSRRRARSKKYMYVLLKFLDA
jgi:hypothetical protein